MRLQVNERGGALDDREDQRKQNGGLHEEAAPKQHRKPERTLRYTDTTSHPLCIIKETWFSPKQNSYESCPSLLSIENDNYYMNVFFLYSIVKI